MCVCANQKSEIQERMRDLERRRNEIEGKAVSNCKIKPRVSFVFVKKDRVFGFKELKETRTKSGVSCEGYSDREAELGLESEILMFMKNSSNPNEFPTKKQLSDAGRIDLVDAISKTGGWPALGWDYSDDENDFENYNFDHTTDLQTTPKNFQQRQDPYDNFPDFLDTSHQSASPSGRSLETVPDEDTGVEGILSRLKKHRSLSFDVHMEKNIYHTYDFFLLSARKRKRDEFPSRYRPGGHIPQQDGSADVIANKLEVGEGSNSGSSNGVKFSSRIPELDGPIADPYDDALSTPNIYDY
ncbi:hypothetical protein L2E82_37968 [Cichorium intybus]|uniref:Uncharacterized protein n=1 Tax=Cichorium intybus TaxID=13427 RepID=A0ACB9AGC3_CICIN|nr:hypothetical protein L2E82_37968 [Cichorium intybus]